MNITQVLSSSVAYVICFCSFFFKKKNTFESLSKTRLKIEKSLDFEKLIGLQLILIKRKVTIELF